MQHHLICRSELWTTKGAKQLDGGELTALLSGLPPGLLAELREALEESTVPWRVEVVDLSETDAAFRERVLKEGIVWNA